jgi:hypothetical protein
MAKCGCAGGACSCSITPGANVRIKGNGSAATPYVIEATLLNLVVDDTATINLTLVGDGTPTNPLSLSADYIGSTDLSMPSSTATWAGAVNLSAVTSPATVRATLNGNVTSLTLPTWASTKSGAINLILTQDATGSRTWVMPGTSASGTDIILSTAANARDFIEAFWTGAQWILTAKAKAVS